MKILLKFLLFGITNTNIVIQMMKISFAENELTNLEVKQEQSNLSCK